MTKTKDTASGVHPKVLARRLGVHLRTIFRWAASETLRLRKGRILITEAEIQRILDDWKRTYSIGETAAILKITNRTLESWRQNEPLSYIYVLGELRYVKNSVHELRKRLRPGRHRDKLHDPNPEYCPKFRLMLSLGLRPEMIDGLIRFGKIPTEIVDGKKMIPIADAEAIERKWFGSCWRSEAARILGTDRYELEGMIDRGRVEEELIFGRRRIILSSLPRTPREKRRVEQFVRAQERRLKAKQERPKEYYWRAKRRKARKARLKLRMRKMRTKSRTRRLKRAA